MTITNIGTSVEKTGSHALLVGIWNTTCIPGKNIALSYEDKMSLCHPIVGLKEERSLKSYGTGEKQDKSRCTY